MNIKAHRSGLLCLLFLALCLLAGASHGQETRSQLDERISELRAEEQNLGDYRAELQHDLRELDDDESGPSQYVVVTARKPYQIDKDIGIHILVPKEHFANWIATHVLIGTLTPREASAYTRHILSETKAFPREARKKIVEIGQELEGIKQELSALEARLARLLGNDDRDTTAGFTIESNTRRYGQIQSLKLLEGGQELKDCQAICAGKRGCLAFTFIRANYESPGDPAVCLTLYEKLTTTEKCDGCTSGIRKRPS